MASVAESRECVCLGVYFWLSVWSPGALHRGWEARRRDKNHDDDIIGNGHVPPFGDSLPLPGAHSCMSTHRLP